MSELGPYQRNQIYCGKSEILMESLPDDCIDLTVTSPPYDNLRDYNGFTLDWHKIIRELYRVTKPGGVVVWVVGDGIEDGGETGTSFRQALWAMGCGFNLHQTLFYDKTNGPPPDPTRYERNIEFMFVFSKGKPKTINLLKDKKNNWAGFTNFGQKKVRNKNGDLEPRKNNIINDYGKRLAVWAYATGAGYTTKDRFADHPAMFPEALAHDHIASWSNAGELIFDPFSGSGTVAKMAFQNGRDYLGFDCSEEYCELSRRRVRQAQPPLLVVS